MSYLIDITTAGQSLDAVRAMVERCIDARMSKYEDDGDEFFAAVVDECRITVGGHEFEDDDDLHFSRYPFHVQLSGPGDILAIGHRLFDAFKAVGVPALLTEDLQVRIDEFP